VKEIESVLPGQNVALPNTVHELTPYTGISPKKVLDALQKHGGKTEEALDALLNASLNPSPEVAPPSPITPKTMMPPPAKPSPARDASPRKGNTAEEDALIAKELQEAFDTAETQKAKLQR
jgi:hypothetical protein